MAICYSFAAFLTRGFQTFWRTRHCRVLLQTRMDWRRETENKNVPEIIETVRKFCSNCVVPKNIHTPPRRDFCVRPPTPWNFRNFSTWLGTLWKEYLCKKKVVALYFYAKDIFPVVKWEKTFSFMLIRCLTLLTTRIMSSAKEPVTFKLNNTWTFVTSFQLEHVTRRLKTHQITVNQMWNNAATR